MIMQEIFFPNVKKERERLSDLWRGEVSELLISKMKVSALKLSYLCENNSAQGIDEGSI